MTGREAAESIFKGLNDLIIYYGEYADSLSKRGYDELKDEYELRADALIDIVAAIRTNIDRGDYDKEKEV